MCLLLQVFSCADMLCDTKHDDLMGFCPKGEVKIGLCCHFVLHVFTVSV